MQALACGLQIQGLAESLVLLIYAIYYMEKPYHLVLFYQDVRHLKILCE